MTGAIHDDEFALRENFSEALHRSLRNYCGTGASNNECRASLLLKELPQGPRFILCEERKCFGERRIEF